MSSQSFHIFYLNFFLIFLSEITRIFNIENDFEKLEKEAFEKIVVIHKKYYLNFIKDGNQGKI